MRNSNRCESQDYNTALLTPERRLFFVITFIVVSLIYSRTALGSDWPTYRRDNQRSGISSESLKLPLKLKWTHKASHPPRPAWPEMPAPITAGRMIKPLIWAAGSWAFDTGSGAVWGFRVCFRTGARFRIMPSQERANSR